MAIEVMMIPVNTTTRTLREPMRSAKYPPKGRISVAITTNPAVFIPASVADNWNKSLRNVGK